MWTRDSLDQAFTLKLRSLRTSRRPEGVDVLPVGASAQGGPAWVHLSRLAPGEVLGAFGEEPLTLLTWFEPSSLPGVDAHALSQCFGLTPAQARVAMGLGEGRSPTQIAHEMGVATATVRSHVRHVLARLGQQRAVDVARVLSRPDALWALADERSHDDV